MLQIFHNAETGDRIVRNVKTKEQIAVFGNLKEAQEFCRNPANHQQPAKPVAPKKPTYVRLYNPRGKAEHAKMAKVATQLRNLGLEITGYVPAV